MHDYTAYLVESCSGLMDSIVRIYNDNNFTESQKEKLDERLNYLDIELNNTLQILNEQVN
jgi:hypothetical protein